MYLMTCTRPDLAYPMSILARYVAPGRHRPEHMAAAKRVLRYLCSTSGLGLVLGGRRPVVLTRHADASWADDQATQRSCEAEIYAGAMAAQELRWLTYQLTDLGEPPRSPPVLYQCGQLRLAYVASEANTADIFTKALPPGDHQRFCTMLGSRANQKWRATDSPATEGAAANLSPSQVAALLALLQKQAAASVTTPAATTEAENFASTKTANIRSNVSTSARVAASHLADKGKAPAVEDEPAAPDDFDSDSNSDAGVRDQAEVFEALQTYLAHMEHKIRGGDAAGALKTVGQAQDLIKRRFDVLVVADHAGFDVAERYQLLKTTVVLTSRSFKMAAADMAALKCMKTGFARGSRPFHRDSPHFMPKTMGSGNGCRGFKGTCFRCGQNGNMANTCPIRGHGGNGPAPVV
ncbi:unnamed protein product [Closterium sp. NIES-53]